MSNISMFHLGGDHFLNLRESPQGVEITIQRGKDFQSVGILSENEMNDLCDHLEYLLGRGF